MHIKRKMREPRPQLSEFPFRSFTVYKPVNNYIISRADSFPSINSSRPRKRRLIHAEEQIAPDTSGQLNGRPTETINWTAVIQQDVCKYLNVSMAVGGPPDWLRSAQLKYQFYARLLNVTGQQIKSKSRYEFLDFKIPNQLTDARIKPIVINIIRFCHTPVSITRHTLG